MEYGTEGLDFGLGKKHMEEEKCGPVQHTGPYFSWIGILKYSL